MSPGLPAFVYHVLVQYMRGICVALRYLKCSLIIKSHNIENSCTFITVPVKSSGQNLIVFCCCFQLFFTLIFLFIPAFDGI